MPRPHQTTPMLRSLEDLIALIEAKGREITTALASLRQ
jgi:hypothetical protein